MVDSKKIDLRFTTIQEPVPHFIYEGLERYVKDCNTYYPQPEFLRETLKNKFRLPSIDWVLLTNGVDEAIRITLETFGAQTDIFTPTEHSTTNQFNPSLRTHYSLVDDQYKISTKNTKDSSLFIIANPNNPVGYTEKKDIITLLENNPQAIVVIDEIYSEYAPELSVVDLLQRYQNLVVFRGFSKSYGLAGIRLGYILTNPENIKKISEKVTWSNVSYLSCGAAQVALEHEEYYAELRKKVLIKKESIVEILTKKKYHIIQSLINTITLKFPAEAEATRLVSKLADNGVFINQGNSDGRVGIDNSFVSFVVGTEEQMSRLIVLL